MKLEAGLLEDLELFVITVVLPGVVRQLIVVAARAIVRHHVDVRPLRLAAVHHVGRPLQHHLEQGGVAPLYQGLLKLLVFNLIR